MALFVSSLAMGLPIMDNDSLSIKQKAKFDENSLAGYYHGLAESFIYSQPDSALYYGEKALLTARSLDDAPLKAEIYNSIGSTYYVKGDYNKALENYLHQKQIYDSLGQEFNLGISYNNIGLIYLGQNDYERAINTFKKAITYNDKYNRQGWLMRNNFNLGISYLSLNLTDSAFRYFKKSMAIAINESDQKFLAKNNMFLGELYLKINDLESASFYYLTALGLFEPNNIWDICYTKAGYAKVLLKNGLYSESLKMAEESLALAIQLDAKWEMERIYQIISEIYEQQGDYPSALVAYKKYKQFSDSINNLEKENSIYRLNLANQELENDKLLIDNLVQQQKITDKNITLTIIIGMLLLLVVSAGFIYKNYLQKLRHSEKLVEINLQLEQKNIDLEKANAAKNKLFSVVSHDLVGPIATLRMMIDMTKNHGVTQEEFENSIEKLSQSVDKVIFTLTNLLYWAKSQILGRPSSIKPVAINAIVASTIGLYKSKIELSGLNIVTDISAHHIVSGDENELQLIFRNLIGNALKFTPEGGTITISTKPNDNNFLEIIVSDTGVGMDSERLASLFSYKGKPSSQGLRGETGTGLGLMFCKEVITANGGTIDVDSILGKGTTITFTLPM